MILLKAAWSIIAWILAFSIMAVVFIVGVVVAIFVPFARIQRRGIAQVLGLIPHLTLSRMTISYDDSFDKDRVCVYVMNHTSMLDAHVAIAAIPQVFCGLENAAHLQVPFYGWLMRLASAVPVYPHSEGRTAEITAAARDRASRNISILTFPEGHRTLDGKPRPYKRGAFFMARSAGLPVVVISTRGFYEVLRKGTWIVTPGHIEVRVGPTLETDGLSDDEIDGLAARAHELTLQWQADAAR